jgi:hypothetical protein
MQKAVDESNKERARLDNALQEEQLEHQATKQSLYWEKEAHASAEKQGGQIYVAVQAINGLVGAMVHQESTSHPNGKASTIHRHGP